MKYKIIIGIPSGEILDIPPMGIELLKSNDLIWKRVIIDEDNNGITTRWLSYVYKDSNINDVYYVLSDMDATAWN